MDTAQFIEQMLNDPDEYESADDYLRKRNAMRPPPSFEYMTYSDDDIATKEETSDTLKPGDITKLLRNAPGILGYAGKMEESLQPCSPDDQPDMITTERIPIFLSEKYFQGHSNVESSDRMESQSKHETGAGAKASDQDDPDELYPTIYASDMKCGDSTSTGRVVCEKNVEPGFFTAFEIYQLNRVSKPAKHLHSKTSYFD